MINNNDNLSKNFESITGLKFSSFYSSYKPKLIWHLTKYTNDKEIAEDFADDAFTQALLKIDSYNSEKSQIHTWIYKIAENLVKKDYKDKQRMNVISLDKENNDNLQIINIIPNRIEDDKSHLEFDSILLKKADLVKEAILKLPEKYKTVMILRELENKPYVDIAEMCIKETKIEVKEKSCNLNSVPDFLDLKLINNSDVSGFVNITYKEKRNIKTLELEIEPNTNFDFNRSDIGNIMNIEITSDSTLQCVYRTTTNLSTIKSQISKGRQLIQSMVQKDFKKLDEYGL